METTTAITERRPSRQSLLKSTCERQDLLFNPAAISNTFAAVKTMDDCMALTATGEVPCLLSMAHQPEKQMTTVRYGRYVLVDETGQIADWNQKDVRKWVKNQTTKEEEDD